MYPYAYVSLYTYIYISLSYTREYHPRVPVTAGFQGMYIHIYRDIQDVERERTLPFRVLVFLFERIQKNMDLNNKMETGMIQGFMGFGVSQN